MDGRRSDRCFPCTRAAPRGTDRQPAAVRKPAASAACRWRWQSGTRNTGKDVSVHRDARYARFFQQHREPDDRRAAGASQANAEDRAVALPRDLGSHCGIIDPALPGLDQPRLDGRQVLAEPVLQLAHKVLGIVEQTIDEIDELAVEGLGSLRQALADNLGWVTPRIVDRQQLSHTSIQKIRSWLLSVA